MADTYTQIHIHLVFAVKYRQALISPKWEEKLYKYITGIVQGRGHKLLAINGMPDHIHIFFGLRPKDSLSDLVREVKKASTEFIKNERLCAHRFQWQEGYGAFSCSRQHVQVIIDYVLNQKSHHRKRSFKEEYISFLKEYGADDETEEKFMFEWIECDY